MTDEINYAASARRIFGAIKAIDIKKGESLQPFMEQFEHIRLRNGFVLDAFKCGDLDDARYRFYARKDDASEPYEEPEHLKERGLFCRLGKRVNQSFRNLVGDDNSDDNNDLY